MKLKYKHVLTEFLLFILQLMEVELKLKIDSPTVLVDYTGTQFQREASQRKSLIGSLAVNIGLGFFCKY